MLGKRSRPVQKTQSKSHLMSDTVDYCYYPGPNKSNAFFYSPLFIGFNSKKNAEGESATGSRSPISPLDAKIFTDNCQYKQSIRSPRGFDNPESHGVGLAILAALHNNREPKTAVLSPRKSESRPPSKTLVANQRGSPNPSQPIPIGAAKPVCEGLDRSAMEYSESYTCITSHGPKTTIRQIFDQPAESDNRNPKCCKPAVFEASSYTDAPAFPSADFLSVCYLCRRQLRHGKDIYMYRGDRAFCSVECRYKQIVSDEKERCASVSTKRAAASSPQAPCCYRDSNIFTMGTVAAA